MPNYGDAQYWEDRYEEQKDVTFDWYILIIDHFNLYPYKILII